MIRHRGQPDKPTDWPCFTHDPPLLYSFLSIPIFVLPCSPSPARPSQVCTALLIPAPLQVWGAPHRFTVLSVAKSGLILLAVVPVVS